MVVTFVVSFIQILVCRAEGIQSSGKLEIEISETTASASLIEFARQTGQEIVFSTQLVDGYRLREISGEMTPVEALSKMLEGTPLEFIRDEESRAIAIYISKEESRDLSTEPTGSFYGSIKQNPENQDTNMKKENTFLGKFFRGLLGIAVVSSSASTYAQEVDFDEEEIYVLSPFEVTTDVNDGYFATETLGGTRIRTDYRDLATPLSAVTAQFLDDTASTDNQTLLNYTTSTEVGGLYGNYGGFGNRQGIGDRSRLINPNNNTRVRGLEQADNTRNFFLTDIPWDSFNIDRVEIQRGPNSILFGVGSPAGIINANTIVAQMNGDSGKIENRFGQFNSNRIVADYNVEIIDDMLAVRIAGLYNDQKFRQKPAFNMDERLFVTATYQNQLIPAEWADKTTIRLSAETAEVESNNPRILPPEDNITLWFEDSAGDGVNDLVGLNKALVDMFIYNENGGGNPWNGPLSDSQIVNPFYLPGVQNIDGGTLNGGGVGFWYRNGDSRPMFVSRQRTLMHPGALAADGSVDNSIYEPYGSPMRSSGFYNYAYQMDVTDLAEGNVSRFPFASRGYYKDRSLTDPTIYNFYDYLIDGDNKREFKDWETANLTISQTFFGGRLGMEFVYDRQDYKEWRSGATLSRPYIAIDVNKNLQHQLSQYSRVVDPTGVVADGLIDLNSYTIPGFTPSADQPYANPMAGAAFLSGAGGVSSNDKRTVERETTRYTAFGELKASDFMDPESWLARAIGRHVFTGLFSREEKYETSTEWLPSATTYEWANSLTVAGNNAQLDRGGRSVHPIIYLTDPLFDRSTASGLNLGPIDTYFNPSGTYEVTYFQTKWLYDLDPNGPNYLDPSAPWVGPFGEGSIDPGAALVQADNPANYTGWIEGPATFLSADDGDLDQLITNYNVTQQVVDSSGFVWQGYLFEGLIVPTFGWRKDTLKTFTGSGAEDDIGISSTRVGPLKEVLTNEGETISWGVVAHMPQKWVEKVKFLSNVSAYYNVGENQKVEARYNFDGNPLDNPSAESVDYGVVVNLFDDKLTLKIGRFETKVKNGNLDGGTTMIGSQQHWLYNLEAWGTSNCLTYIFGQEGLEASQDWAWNWALNDEGWDQAWNDPVTQSWRNHPSMIYQMEVVDDWLNNIDKQFFINYDIGANVDEILAAYQIYKSTGDVQPLVAAAAASNHPVGSNTEFGSRNNGQINGVTPNGTIDNTSKGWEVELNYRPVPNWNIQLNASKTDAYRESLGQPMLEFINKQWTKMQGPAGDIRLWWAGDKTIREYYDENIMSAVLFQQEAVGFQVAELRPWHVSLVTNYSIQGDKFKGFNIGGAFRYQDEQILGYGFKDDLSGLSVEKPIYGESESHVDMWLGYERELTDKVGWRVQVNIRNVGEDVGLTPISANPDGSVATQRITEGMAWSVTNTFRF